MKEIIFLNGKWIPESQARISALDEGVLLGVGSFETMRACKGEIIYLKEHLERINKSCGIVGINNTYSLQKTKKIIQQAVSLANFPDAYVRLTLSKGDLGTNVLVIVKRYKPYPKDKYARGIRLGISSFYQNENSILAKLKTANRILYELSYKEAKVKGFDGAIILNNRGYIAEASRSNLFFVKNRELFTPSLECGCLDGITRKAIFDLAKENKISIYEGNFTVRDLYAADEAFLTNSLVGIMPLASLENKSIGVHKCAQITKFLTKKYNCLLK